MKLNYLHSAELPSIDIYVKECINSGQWFLFKTHTNDKTVSFFLKADSDIFALDDQGNMLTSFPLIEEELAMEELYYFDDISRPASLSNQFAMSC